MDKLCCDICGGTLVMQAGGKTATCDSCGMQYSIERMREKVQEITGTVRVAGPVQARQTGTKDDVAQWRALVQKYYGAGDFQAAEQVIKKILEAVPADAEANQIYDDLQVLKYMEVTNGVLVKYTGLSETLIIPNCVKEIGYRAFAYNHTLKRVHIPASVTRIGGEAFFYSAELQSVQIPDSVTRIGSKAFHECRHLDSVIIPDYFDFEYISQIFGDKGEDDIDYSSACPWYNKYRQKYRQDETEKLRKIQQDRRKQWKCQHCGGSFTGFFTFKCTQCGRRKDY